MKDLILTLVAQEPLVITSGSAESMAHECLGYIPGNMLLGAMAAAWKRAHPTYPGRTPDDDPDFQRLFLTGDVSWGHAVPLCEGVPSVPIPLCFGRAKNHDALPSEGTDVTQGEYDVFNYLAMTKDQTVDQLWRERHPHSVETIKTKKMPVGFMNPETLHQAKERRAWNIHVALGDRRSALEGQLFGYSALARGTRLQASVLCRTEEARQALEKLVSGIKTLSVGHSRSAGYGRVRVETAWRERTLAQSAAQKDVTLFFLSQYLPAPSWANPLESLKRELASRAGQEGRIERSFAGFTEIQGYNGLWNRPRTSRLALSAGTVVRFSFAQAVTLPENFSIGAGQHEGYGRVLRDPAFLKEAMPAISGRKAVTVENRTGTFATTDDSLWKLLRERAAARQMEAQATTWLHHPEWQKFLEDAAKLSRPTASQRNNLRDVNVEVFRKMLDKTPGKQWEQAVSYCPFTGRLDHLSEIMLRLLDPKNFSEAYPLRAKDFILPGGDARPDELEKFGRQAHRLFVRQLISVWGKMSRIAAKE